MAVNKVHWHHLNFTNNSSYIRLPHLSSVDLKTPPREEAPKLWWTLFYFCSYVIQHLSFFNFYKPLSRKTKMDIFSVFIQNWNISSPHYHLLLFVKFLDKLFHNIWQYSYVLDKETNIGFPKCGHHHVCVTQLPVNTSNTNKFRLQKTFVGKLFS
jgi:hypothetical protein